MKEVYPNLFVGGEKDIFAFETYITTKVAKEMPAISSNYESFYILQAAKEPWHRKALGYTGRAAPKDHPEYLIARRRQRMVLNLVDVPEGKAQYIPDEALEAGIEYIREACHEKFKPVFVHCNQGWSRGPSMALMFLIEHTDFADGLSKFESVEDKFKGLYPDYQPNGIRLKVKERFERRSKDETQT